MVSSIFEKTVSLVVSHPVTCVLVIFATSLLRTRYRPGLRNVPGPFTASFSNWWKWKAVWRRNMHRENIRVHEDYGPIVRIGPNHVSLADPGSMAAIYGIQTVFKKSEFYPLAEAIYKGRFLPNLFTTQSNEYHAKLKKGAARAFAMDTMIGLESYVDECVELLLARLSEVSAEKRSAIDAVAWMQYFAFDVLGQINFSKDLGFMKKGGDVDSIIAAIHGILGYVSLIGQAPLMHKFLLGNPFLPKLLPSIEKTNQVLQFSLARIEERKKEPSTRRDILSQLFATSEKDPTLLTEDEIVAITTTNVIAGSDTTAISLASVLYNLGKYPKARASLEAEMASAIQSGKVSQPITYAEATRLPYLSAVIDESIRVHPATGFILERLVPKGGVELCGIHLPENTVVGVNTWVLHRNKDVFGEDSEVFRPERWIENDNDQIRDMKRNLFTFGYGPRSCIGKNISMLEMWKVVFELYRTFDVQLEDPKQELAVDGRWFTTQRSVKVVLTKKKEDWFQR
ncbi:cytochrome P450 [Elsinoe ampelina]|uniref:Cytochrome P450 n=1 Tax=Elsinoe ampelina TaxID=302913 RepID=A0A6A6G112_9PEZI|nr:cytochrome P450 [Elsinoe ampelina]